jgi:hypothetical protein
MSNRGCRCHRRQTNGLIPRTHGHKFLDGDESRSWLRFDGRRHDVSQGAVEPHVTLRSFRRYPLGAGSTPAASPFGNGEHDAGARHSVAPDLDGKLRRSQPVFHTAFADSGPRGSHRRIGPEGSIGTGRSRSRHCTRNDETTVDESCPWPTRTYPAATAPGRRIGRSTPPRDRGASNITNIQP